MNSPFILISHTGANVFSCPPIQCNRVAKEILPLVIEREQAVQVTRMNIPTNLREHYAKRDALSTTLHTGEFPRL
jgi:hypothetical protein